MKLFNCLSPVYVKNPYTNEEIVVPCGKCAACLCRKQNSWVERLEIERLCHPYTAFITLTYDDNHIPKFTYKDGNLIDDDGCIVLDCVSEQFDYVDYLYLKERGFVNTFNKKHLQLFIKRLRSKLVQYEQNKFHSFLRYFIVSEYGPRTWRPHYHALLFFESDWLAANLDQVVSSCWSTDTRCKNSETYGIIDAQLVRNTASSYVAGYLNCSSDMPSVFKHSLLRPFSLFSRCPPLGSLLVGSSEIRQLFDTSASRMSVYSHSKGSYISLPLTSSLRNRLWPKVKSFAQLDFALLVRCYKHLQESGCLTFKEYEDYCDFYVNTYPNQEFSLWLKHLIENSDSALCRYYGIQRRVIYQSMIFGVTINEYVEKLIRYYENCASDNYADCLDYVNQEIEFKRLLPKELLLLDPIFIDRVRNAHGALSPSDLFILKSYDYDENSLSDLDSLSAEKLSEFNQTASFCYEKKIKNVKVRSAKDWFSPYVDFTSENLIKKYYGKK